MRSMSQKWTAALIYELHARLVNYFLEFGRP